jgi:hypothetical protein
MGDLKGSQVSPNGVVHVNIMVRLAPLGDGSGTPGSDAAAWLAGASEENDLRTMVLAAQAPIGQKTIEGLREIGLLDEIITTKEGLVVYPVSFAADES